MTPVLDRTMTRVIALGREHGFTNPHTADNRDIDCGLSVYLDGPGIRETIQVDFDEAPTGYLRFKRAWVQYEESEGGDPYGASHTPVDEIRRLRDLERVLSQYVLLDLDTPVMTRDPSKHTPRRTVRIPDEVWDAAKEAAEANGEQVSDVIRDALTRYVARSKRRKT